jgi:hypothetical protein
LRASINRSLVFFAIVAVAGVLTSPASTAPGDPGYSAIPFIFNGTTIAAGRTVWFNSVLKLNGTVPAGDVVINFSGQKITIASLKTFNLPDTRVTYSTSATSATTTFNSALNRWETTIPKGLATKNAFLGGYAYLVPSPFKGDSTTYPITWSGTFGSPQGDVNINWQWGAAVYTSFGAGDALGVKPTDDNQASVYKNSDHAGTPEAFKSPPPVGGATGGGASNFTGSYSGTAGVTPLRMNAPLVTTVARINGTSYLGASTIADTATLTGGSSAPAATGSISFAVYGPNDANCTSSPVSTTSVQVNGNGTYVSPPYTPAPPGKYRFVASYSGDTYNTPITTSCGDMNENVTLTADTTAPLCTLIAIHAESPKSADVLVQDSESGVTSITHHETNAVVMVPALPEPTTTGLAIHATKVNQSQDANFGLTVKDAAGNTAVCDPLLGATAKTHPHRTTNPQLVRGGGVTLRIDSSRLAFGTGITLTGTAQSRRAGETVSLLVRPCGFNGLAELATLRTGAGGTFRYATQPSLGTAFAVSSNGVTSPTVHVAVSPRVTLTQVAGHRYRVDVTTTNPLFLAGSPVLLQGAAGNGWKTIARTKLVKSSGDTAVTVVSSATFSAPAVTGKLRAVVPGTACYARAHS